MSTSKNTSQMMLCPSHNCQQHGIQKTKHYQILSESIMRASKSQRLRQRHHHQRIMKTICMWVPRKEGNVGVAEQMGIGMMLIVYWCQKQVICWRKMRLITFQSNWPIFTMTIGCNHLLCQKFAQIRWTIFDKLVDQERNFNFCQLLKHATVGFHCRSL